MADQSNEAKKCLELAKKKFAQNDVEGAIRLAKKAKRMDSSLDIDVFLNQWVEEEEVEIKLTKKQEELLNRILGTDPADFYSILELDKNCTEIEVKKSYRKLALHLHPDKCNHPQAQDAFLKVSKAFNVLSDANKKRMFDHNGLDPEDRSAQASQYQRSQHMRETFNMDDILAEQIFAQFFGMNANQFQGFNSPNMRRTQHSFQFARQQQQQRPQRNRGDGNDGSLMRLLIQCVPLFLFIALSILPALLKVKNPTVSLNPVNGFSTYTTPRKFQYFASPQDMDRFSHGGGDIKRFEAELDEDIISKYRQRCHHERDYKNQQMSMASNTWFGLKPIDENALQRAKNIKTTSCTELERRGINY